MEPFIHPGVPVYIMNMAEKSVGRQIEQLRGWSTRLHVSLDLHAPTLLLPQKTASPNLIIMNMGKFTIIELHRMSVLHGVLIFLGKSWDFLERKYGGNR
jgi:hypothetical protein